MINVIVCGAAGKMGTSILRLLSDDKGFKIIGGVESKEFLLKCPKELKTTSDLSEIIGGSDVIIDFSNISGTLEHLSIAEKNKKAMVIGTTGFKDSQIEVIKKASKGIPIVFSPNMSVGVNLLFKIVQEVASKVPDYDVEIVELHHNQKKDAPSGTAMNLARIIANALGRKIEEVGVYGRKGEIGPRKKGEIGISSVRAGDIVGDHIVYFAGPGERLELAHRAHSRDTLAAGALVAAKWVIKQKPGLYDMQDVLTLK